MGNAQGRAFARQREKMHAKLGKIVEMRAEAKALSDKASRMEARGVVMAGDAKAAHDSRVAACAVVAGQMVDTTHYGIRRVLKVNKVTVLVEGAFGPLKVGKEFVHAVA